MKYVSVESLLTGLLLGAFGNVGNSELPDRERSFEFNLPDTVKRLPRAIGQWLTSSPDYSTLILIRSEKVTFGCYLASQA